jgi:hypothetical protein
MSAKLVTDFSNTNVFRMKVRKERLACGSSAGTGMRGGRITFLT